MPDPRDRRTVRAALTPEGRAAVGRLLEAHVAHEEALLRDLTPQERATLRELLLRIAPQDE